MIAIILALGLKGTTMAPYLGWIAIVFVCIYVSAFTWSWGPLVWLIASEIYPSETQSARQAITVSTNMLFTFIIGQVRVLINVVYLQMGGIPLLCGVDSGDDGLHLLIHSKDQRHPH